MGLQPPKKITTEQSDTLCWGDTATLAGVGTLTRDTTVVRRLTSVHGCDSVVTNSYFSKKSGQRKACSGFAALPACPHRR